MDGESLFRWLPVALLSCLFGTLVDPVWTSIVVWCADIHVKQFRAMLYATADPAVLHIAVNPGYGK
jgi:hypothetical protein